MAGYTRIWHCGDCGERCETIDWPKVEVCDSCERRRVRRAEAAARETVSWWAW